MIELLTRDRLVADLQAFLTALDPNISVAKDTDAGVRIESLVDALLGVQSQLVATENDLIPSTATSTEALERHAEVRLGPAPRKQATTTDIVEDALTVTGTASSAIPAGTILTHIDGTLYQVSTAATIPAGGSVTVDLQSTTKGTGANKAAGEKLTFQTPPAGVTAEATLALAMTGATDAETDAELLNRLIDAIRNPFAGGRFSDYRQWAMAVAKVAGAWCYGPQSVSAALNGRQGLGVVDVAVTSKGTGAARRPAVETCTAVKTAIDAKRPVAMAALNVLRPTTVSQDFDLAITPASGYAWDWSTSLNWTVSAWAPTDPAGPKLTWNTNLPADVVAGVRIVCEGQLAVVVSVGADYTILDRALTGITAGGGTPSRIFPGGPLTAPILAAVKAYADALGPARGVAYDRQQAGWDDSVRLSSLFKAIMLIAGVEDVSILTPSTTVTPADHAPSGTVDLLIYGRITVRPGNPAMTAP